MKDLDNYILNSFHYNFLTWEELIPPLSLPKKITKFN